MADAETIEYLPSAPYIGKPTYRTKYICETHNRLMSRGVARNLTHDRPISKSVAKNVTHGRPMTPIVGQITGYAPLYRPTVGQIKSWIYRWDQESNKSGCSGDMLRVLKTAINLSLIHI